MGGRCYDPAGLEETARKTGKPGRKPASRASRKRKKEKDQKRVQVAVGGGNWPRRGMLPDRLPGVRAVAWLRIGASSIRGSDCAAIEPGDLRHRTAHGRSGVPGQELRWLPQPEAEDGRPRAR